MSAFLYRLGGLMIVGDILYLAITESTGHSADSHVFLTILMAAGVCLAGGLLISVVTRASSGITAPTCPRCGKRVAHGRVFCEEHLHETINRYRDQERRKGD